ncbi:MAG: hypothetical protein U0271_14755 [Polyangiaceae bacterium]
MTSTTDTITTAENLSDMVRRNASRETIASFLDAQTVARRLELVLAVRGSLVGKLYDAVGGGEPWSPEDIVPADEMGTVILEGRNSLPAFTRFQKRFARVHNEVVGYNHQLMSFATGPGYFVVRPPTRGETVEDELFFDYTSLPAGIPAGWPRFETNEVGLSRAVYMDMKDYCRRVARGVLVGKAYKRGVAQNAFFTLTWSI